MERLNSVNKVDKMRIPKILVLIATLLSFSLNAHCWGGPGHKLIGDVAYHYASQNTKDSLRFYLGDVSLADAGLWMDEMRKYPEYDYMKPWHYITIKQGESYQPNKDENVINELNKRIDHLKHRNLYTKEQVAVDIKILTHLVEDLHMPLHVGYPDDSEGLAVHITFIGKPTSLHWAWDNDIMLQQNINADTCLALLAGFPKRYLTEMEKTDIILWMNESRSYLGNVYDFNGYDIDLDYANKNATIIKLRLAFAGLRLGYLLNTLFQ